jgi:hypothetical protein
MLEISYNDFRLKVDSFKSLIKDAKKGNVELFILELINEFSPKFVWYKSLEMIEEGDFDEDLNVRDYFKRLLWDEIIEEYFENAKKVAFKTDEEIIEELNKTTFLETHRNFIPLQIGQTQALFDKQMAEQNKLAEQMSAIVEHPFPSQYKEDEPNEPDIVNSVPFYTD